MDKEKVKEKVKEKILRWQLLAEQYFKENRNVFIETLNEDIYFCKIVIVGETKLCVDVYAPKQRKGKREYIDWLDIIRFNKVNEKEKNGKII